MSEEALTERLPVPTADEAPLVEPVYVDLCDGFGPRPLAYTVGSMKRLKRKLGTATMGRKSGLLDLDEDMLPELILEGLKDKAGKLPEGVSMDTIDAVPSHKFNDLVEAFSKAYTRGQGQKKASLPATTE